MHQVTFIQDGWLRIGYEINKKRKYVLETKREVCGTYEVFFDKRCHLMCKAVSECTGFFIRKEQWILMEDIFPAGYQQMKNMAFEYYDKQIY